MMQGVVFIDKPAGITSFDVVRKVRQKLKIKKAGHCGTLDPLATGLLVILLGPSTKLFSMFSSFDKAYEATLELGVTTTTGDSQGDVLCRSSVENISGEQVQQVFGDFKGAIAQVPPMFSALKYKGKKLYELARQGIEVPRKQRTITIFDLRVTAFHAPYVDFYLHCSKGTYVRSLASDIGARLHCGACIVKIRRVGIGSITIHDAVALDQFNESHIRHWPS